MRYVRLCVIASLFLAGGLAISCRKEHETMKNMPLPPGYEKEVEVTVKTTAPGKQRVRREIKPLKAPP